ncbi:hypothetical protein K466DRAFT_72931 [Polyporus arcularius HHB13444]|uniref:SAP domain-containing protein n=1 Tax=Polyporus arcularius HHB13444 TaxID=1314778 RepID=A0A5C3PGL6_9APHY|nr:hypothetical protein K466DRAFT_72931 [Polyporus arcularius HHB13444]
MNEGELKALPRVQLQKLAKSNGVRANGKSVDIIKQLLEYYNAKPADRNDDGLNDAAITRPNVSPSKLALRSKESTAQNTGNAASDMALEPVVPDEDGAPQAGPSGRSDRRVTGATNSEEIAGKGNESVIPRLSQRMHDGEHLSPVQQTAGNSARSSALGRRASGVSPFAQDVEAGSSARTSVLVPRASTVSHSVQGTGESKRGSASTSDMIRRGTSPSRRTGTSGPSAIPLQTDSSCTQDQQEGKHLWILTTNHPDSFRRYGPLAHSNSKSPRNRPSSSRSSSVSVKGNQDIVRPSPRAPQRRTERHSYGTG